MAFYSKVGQSSRQTSLYNGNLSSGTRTDFRLACGDTGSPASGTFVTLPGGTRFRKATNRTRWTSWIEPREAQIITGTRTTTFHNGEPGWQRESSGGYFGDDFIRNSSATSLIANSSNEVGGCLNQGSDDPPIIPTLMRNEAVTKALLKLADQKVGMGENLGTLGQTIRMLKNPLQSIARAVKMFKRDKHLKNYFNETYRSLRRRGVAESISDKYLEYVYGVKPLMQDVYGIIEMAKELGVIDNLLHAEASSHREFDLRYQIFTNVSGDSLSTFNDGRERAKVKCSLWARIDPSYQGLRALNQLGLANPLALAWELTSMSFVVDWVLPIGAVLNALTAPAGLVFVDGTISVRTSCQGNLRTRGTAIYNGNYSNSNYSPSKSLWRYEGYKRTTLSNWPLPGLWYNPDPLQLESGGDRWLKAIALAISRL